MRKYIGCGSVRTEIRLGKNKYGYDIVEIGEFQKRPERVPRAFVSGKAAAPAAVVLRSVVREFYHNNFARNY